ncbi:MAG: DAK2 domain-containing protein, partial [Clostridia bacterium]|nr:DAK2 domain-containing protein [Clostridia bacterium]
GDCVVVVDDEEIIKTHVHTENPGNALQKALEYGQLLTVKIENMKEQHRKAAEANEKQKAAAAAVEAAPEEKAAPVVAEPTEDFGFVAVAAGEGIQNLFRDLGCEGIVSGGQTMNPSTDDILAAILAVPAKTVYVLPNNKNIVMAAEQTVDLVTDREVVIVPTRTIPQGLSAMLVFDAEADAETNRAAMVEAASHVGTGQVTFAARDSDFGGKKIKANDILGLENGKLRYVEDDVVNTAVKLTRAMVEKDTAFITLIYGEGVTEEQAQQVYDRVRAKVNSDVEITLVNGGQPVYYFIISLE